MWRDRADENGLLAPSPSSATCPGAVANAISVPAPTSQRLLENISLLEGIISQHKVAQSPPYGPSPPLTLSANILYVGQVVTWAAAKLPH
jgi:hypothetical protein